MPAQSVLNCRMSLLLMFLRANGYVLVNIMADANPTLGLVVVNVLVEVLSRLAWYSVFSTT